MDPRGFGTLKVIYGRTAFLKKLESLGPDMLTEPPSLEVFTARLDTKPNWTICKALMDQSVVSGIGSRTLRKIVEASLVDEDRIIGSLSSSEIEKLYIFAKKVLAKLYQDNLHES
jgi:formamidopyrimidine-DNA glycosylase